MSSFDNYIDEQTGNIHTSGKLSVGKIRSAFQGGVGDSDWFKLELTAGQSYVFTLSNTAINNLTTIGLILRDAAGVALVSETGNLTYGFGFEYKAERSGTYFLDASGQNLWLSTVEYEITMDLKPAGDDFASGSATAGRVSVGGTATGMINNPGDVDSFRFDAQKGLVYSLAPAAANAGALRLSVTDAQGKVLAKPGESFVALAAGQYYVSASAYKLGTYSFSLGKAVDDFSNDHNSIGRLDKGGSMQGTVNHIGDADWFRVTLDAGIFYTFDLKRDAEERDFLTAKLLRADGTALPFKHTLDIDGNTSLLASVPSAGDYYVAVTYDDYYSGSTSKPYTLTFAAATLADDFGDTVALAKQVGIGVPVTGELTSTGDIDVMKLALQAGVGYSFSLNSLTNAHLRLELKQSGVDYPVWQMWGAYDVTTFTPSASGSYTMHIQTLSDNYALYRDPHMSYMFTARQVLDDYPASSGTPGRLAVGSTVTGSLAAEGGDKDWFGMDLQAGVTYFARLDPVSVDTQGTTSISIRDANGVSLQSASADGLTIKPLSFTPSVSGKFYLEVSALTTASGHYKASLEVGTDDFPNDALSAVRLQPDLLVRGTLEAAGDMDFFRIGQLPGKPTVLQFESPAGSTFGDAHVLFLNASGYNINPASFSYTGNLATYFFDGASLLEHAYVRGFAGKKIPYTIKTFAMPVDDYANSMNTTAAIAPNSSVTALIDYLGDVDVFQVQLEAGKRYAIDLWGAASGAGSFDASRSSSMQLLTRGGDPIAWGDPALKMAEGRLVLMPPRTDTFFLYIQNAESGRSTGSYKVTLAELTGDTTAPKLSTAPAATIASTATLSLGFDDLVQFDASKFSIRDALGAVVLDSALLGIAPLHNVLTVDPLRFLQPGTAYKLDIAAGGVSDLAGNALAGALSFDFQTAAASPGATPGADLLVLRGQGNMLDGGAGADVAVLQAMRADYQLIALPDGATQLQPVAGGASEVLRNIERVHFADKAIALDVNANAGAVYRLYQAAFDRTPDGRGLGYWIDQVDKGTSIRTVAQAFVGSAEFQMKYGSAPTNAEFVDLLYANVLHRAGEAAGVAYWNKVLDSGYARELMLAAFADSGENVAAVAQAVGFGFEYIPY
jgi:hypothetical protein